MSFSETLVNWYQENKRDLPWRNTTDAYIIWLSEIILQQTRVEQGMPYFYRFAEKYPTVTDFAAAPEDEILRLWQGLGYYSRGRNMLTTARLVKELYGDKFPQRYDDLIKLKGIGEYTAAAISSFAANEARAVVDGNVYRVLARYFGISEPINSAAGKKLFQQTANEILNHSHAGLHNQAMMEFGALVCKPKNPACGICPVHLSCYAFLNNAVNVLPVKLNKLKVRERYFNYLVVVQGDQILLNKRNDKDIWANMYDLPMIETTGPATAEDVFSSQEVEKHFGINIKLNSVDGPYKHLLTHQRLYVNFLIVDVTIENLKASWIFCDINNLNNYALPKIIYLFLGKFFKFKFNLVE